MIDSVSSYGEVWWCLERAGWCTTPGNDQGGQSTGVIMRERERADKGKVRQRQTDRLCETREAGGGTESVCMFAWPPLLSEKRVRIFSKSSVFIFFYFVLSFWNA